jgi:hypothetical protein
MEYFKCIKTILFAIIEKKLPPTISARTLFIFNSTVIVGLNTILKLNLIDNYTYKNTYPKVEINEKFTNDLILYLSKLSFELLNRDIKSKNIFNYVIQLNNEMNKSEQYIKFLSNNSTLLNLISEDVSYYYNQRNNDGWKDSNSVIPLVNQAVINVKLPINTNLMQNPEQWCPLKNQHMLGAKWGDVKGLINTNKINNFLNKAFPKINIKSQAKQVLDVSLHLTTEQKAIAEFWAGIGGSVTPPGFFNMFLYGYFVNNPSDNLNQVEYFYKLNCGLFEASIVCWNAKYKFLQCRPIQSIRINYPDIPINYYFGKSNTNLWTPYQESRLYTPPFPDFISGHSTFSSSAATILTNLFGKDLHKLNIILTKDDFVMLSPIFKNMEEKSMNITNIIVPANSSQIVRNTPKQPIILKFNTWSDMADSAGISRVYGGIHYPTSNELALKVGKCIGKKIITKGKSD